MKLNDYFGGKLGMTATDVHDMIRARAKWEKDR